MLPTVRRTWAPRGPTPFLHHRTRSHKKVSTIGALTISPGRHRLGLYLHWHPDKNIRTIEVIAFLAICSAIFAGTSFLCGIDSTLIAVNNSQTGGRSIQGSRSSGCHRTHLSSIRSNTCGATSSITVRPIMAYANSMTSTHRLATRPARSRAISRFCGPSFAPPNSPYDWDHRSCLYPCRIQ